MGLAFDHATHTFELDFGHEKQTFYSALVIGPIPTRWSWELRVLELVKIARKILTGFFTNSIFIFGFQNLNRGVGPAPFELG